MIALLDQADIANSDIMSNSLLSRKRSSVNDGFAIDLNISQYIRKYKMSPPKLVRKPPKSFFEVQEQFMRRGFEEMKEWLKSKIEEHLKLVSQQNKHKINCDIETTPVHIEEITLFTIRGEVIQGFEQIDQDSNIIIISTDGVFKGLSNTLRPSDFSKQRILNEKHTRNTFNNVKEQFSHKNVCLDDQDCSISKKFHVVYML